MAVAARIGLIWPTQKGGRSESSVHDDDPLLARETHESQRRPKRCGDSLPTECGWSGCLYAPAPAWLPTARRHDTQKQQAKDGT
jgi:hypothetical protein